MDVAAVSSVSAGHPTQTQPTKPAQPPVAPNATVDQVEISPEAKALQALTGQSDPDHDGD